MTNVLAVLLAIFKAIPALKDFWDQLVANYIAAEIARMADENQNAIRKALSETDQRPIEDVIKSPRAGLPSGIDGTDIVDELPDVVPSKHNS